MCFFFKAPESSEEHRTVGRGLPAPHRERSSLCHSYSIDPVLDVFFWSCRNALPPTSRLPAGGGFSDPMLVLCLASPKESTSLCPSDSRNRPLSPPPPNGSFLNFFLTLGPFHDTLPFAARSSQQSWTDRHRVCMSGIKLSYYTPRKVATSNSSGSDSWYISRSWCLLLSIKEV